MTKRKWNRNEFRDMVIDEIQIELGDLRDDEQGLKESGVPREDITKAQGVIQAIREKIWKIWGGYK